VSFGYGGRLVVAYHGCDESTADRLVSRGGKFRPSNNKYDWLGSGVYFFEDDSRRALHFAETAAANPGRKFSRGVIERPAVVGVVLRLHRILDLSTQDGIDEFATAYHGLEAASARTGQPMPVNRRARADDAEMLLHNLDRAVIEFVHAAREEDGLAPYEAVRAPFTQGSPIAPTSAILDRTHIQLALRDVSCVVGVSHAVGK
jgi:hypothetical protein